MKALIFYRHFPVAMGRYIHWALQNIGYEVLSVGEYSGGKIPWGDQYYYPRYMLPPNIQTPPGNVSYEAVKAAAKKLGFVPDIVVQCADTVHMVGKTEGPNILIGTDPHAVDYSEAKMYADVYISMQEFYRGSGLWMPYGYDADMISYKTPRDSAMVVFCGLQYEHRISALKRMERIMPVSSKLGLIYEDYVDEYQRGQVAFNWSSKNDLPARFWEGLAMGNIVLTNRVPDLEKLDCHEWEHYIAYDHEDELIEKLEWIRDNQARAKKIGSRGGRWVTPHTYTNHFISTMKQWNSGKYLP